MVKKLKIIKVIVLIFLINSCSPYYGKKDESGKLRVKEKYWTLKNISNKGIKGVLDTKVWYQSQYSFTNNDLSFTIQKQNSYEDSFTILWFFDSGQVLKFVSYAIDEKKIKNIINESDQLNFGSKGFYTIGSDEFEIEFFQEQNVSLFGSMDRYYYKALIKDDKLHLIRRDHSNKYTHTIYQKVEMPEALKNQSR